jgi:hypothetical protein
LDDNKQESENGEPGFNLEIGIKILKSSGMTNRATHEPRENDDPTATVVMTQMHRRFVMELEIC